MSTSSFIERLKHTSCNILFHLRSTTPKQTEYQSLALSLHIPNSLIENLFQRLMPLLHYAFHPLMRLLQLVPDNQLFILSLLVPFLPLTPCVTNPQPSPFELLFRVCKRLRARFRCGRRDGDVKLQWVLGVRLWSQGVGRGLDGCGYGFDVLD